MMIHKKWKQIIYFNWYKDWMIDWSLMLNVAFKHLAPVSQKNLSVVLSLTWSILRSYCDEPALAVLGNS